MSKFKTIQQQNAEKTIETMFAGLEDDVALKTVMRVMYGLEDESILEELKRVNEANLASLNEHMSLKQEDVVSSGKVFQNGEPLVPPNPLLIKSTDVNPEGGLGGIIIPPDIIAE